MRIIDPRYVLKTAIAGLFFAGCTASRPAAPTLAVSAECARPADPVSALRARGSDSVITQGVVVGDYEGANGLRGFYLQGDGAAVFVHNGTRDDVNVGDRVRVTGTLATERAMQLEASAITTCGSGTVEPVALTLPLDDSTPLARYDGMLVQFPQTLYVTEHYQLGRYGEVQLASGGVPLTPTQVVQPGADAQARQREIERNRIVLDDASWVENPASLFGRGAAPLSAENTLRVGDAITGLRGVLTRTSATAPGPNGSRGVTWRVRPVNDTARVMFTPINARNDVPPDVGGTLRIASFNVLNFFSAFGDGCPFGCRGADNAVEFDRQSRKLVSAISALDAAVVGVIEIGNDGYGPGSSITVLTERLNAATSPGRYAFIDADARTGERNALGTDAIKVGLLYQPSRVTPTGRTAVLNTATFVNAGDRAERNRPSLVQTFEAVSGGRVVVSVNHFKSKGSACDAPDANDGQGQCNAVRTRAAKALLDWLATDPTNTGESRVLVLGDLNAYAQEDPVRTFRERGFADLIARHSDADGYSYVFGGARGRLDHALASATLAPLVTGAAVWHINADEPPVLDYNSNFKSTVQLEALYGANPYRSSDHDPVVVGVRLGR
jgi:predicted extracellular nuclease